jgi:hypothetical protein
MSRGSSLGLRIVILALLIIVAAWGSMWAYVGYEAHRARLMLAEVSLVRIGDSEASVLPLVRRYGGFQWTPGPLALRDNWIDKYEYDYQQNRVSDYNYALEVSPFGTASLHTIRRSAQAMREVRAAVPARLRPILGMRDWGAEADLAVRCGRVQSVSAMTLAAGRSGWVGHRWKIAEGMPRYEMRQRAYAVGAAVLEMPDGGGMMIENYVTPEASEEEVAAARQFNARCSTSIKGCDGLCDVAPRALKYLEQHPDAAWNIIPPKCP